MYRLLIAEDEKWIRAGLVRTVDWAGLGFGQVLEDRKSTRLNSSHS